MGRTTQYRVGPDNERRIVSVRISNATYNHIVDATRENADGFKGPRTVTDWITEAIQEKFKREQDLAQQRKEGILQTNDEGEEDYILPGLRQW